MAIVLELTGLIYSLIKVETTIIWNGIILPEQAQDTKDLFQAMTPKQLVNFGNFLESNICIITRFVFRSYLKIKKRSLAFWVSCFLIEVN